MGGPSRSNRGGPDRLGDGLRLAAHLRVVVALHHHTDQGLGTGRPQPDPPAVRPAATPAAMSYAGPPGMSGTAQVLNGRGLY